MSKTKNARLLELENLASHLRGLRYANLPPCNTIRIADSLTLWWAILTDVFTGLQEAELLELLNRYRYNFSKIVELITSCSDRLRSLPETEDYSGFKHHVQRVFGHMATRFQDVLEQACQFDPASFSQLDTVFSFLKKINLIDPLIEKKALTDYEAVEKGLSGPYTEEECYLFQHWFPKRSFPRFVYSNFYPRHGNGAVADIELPRAPILQKHAALGRDLRTDYLCNQGLPYSDLWSPFSGNFDRCSRTVFVPKSFKAYRTISMEPATLMWYQQGVSYALRKWCNRLLDHRYQPEDQRMNRFLAQKGSLSGSFATIDLHAASDSVSWEMVKQWTRETGLYRFLLCTRSTQTNVNGNTIPLRKFAPMGSALNFDIESLVFCAIISAALEVNGICSEQSKFRVYGDDIVIETQYVDFVCRRLEANGFKVNESKSFTGRGKHCYRESCGGYYLDGFNVTPTVISRKFVTYHIPSNDNRTSLGSLVPQLIDLANDLVGFDTARQLVISQLIKLPKSLRPVFTPDFSGLWSPEATNFDKSIKYDLSIQRLVARAGGVHQYYEPIPDNLSTCALNLWFYRTHERTSLIRPEDLTPLPRNTGKTKWTSKVVQIGGD